MIGSGRKERIKSIFLEVSRIPLAERGPFLDRVCGADDSLRIEVESLLRESTEEQEKGTVAATGLAAEIPGVRLMRILGEGGMGTVWEAEQERPRRRVAVKVMRGGPDNVGLVRRFDREADVLAALDHPGIATIHAAGQTADGRPYFMMELVAGEPLDRHVDGRKLGLGERLALFERVCAAVQFAHERGVIHRDLKPANILVREDGQPKILDFGIARLSRDDGQQETTTRTGAVLGTLEYMSPEQVRGEVRSINASTDVYALGVLLYRMLTGRLPIDLGGAGLMEAVWRIGNQAPTPPSHLATGVSPEIDRVVLKALAKEQRSRFQSAAELMKQVQACAALPTDTPAVRPRLTKHTARLAPGCMLQLTIGSVSAAAVLLAAVAVFWKPPAGRELPAVGAVAPGSGERRLLIGGGADPGVPYWVRWDMATFQESLVAEFERLGREQGRPGPAGRVLALDSLGAVTEEMGALDEARRRVQQRLREERTRPTDESAQTDWLRLRLARLNAADGRRKEARDLIQQVESGENTVFAPIRAELALTEAHLHRLDENWREAEREMKAVFDQMERSPEEQLWAKWRMTWGLWQLANAQDDEAGREKWRREMEALIALAPDKPQRPAPREGGPLGGDGEPG